MKNYVELKIINYNPETLEKRVCPHFSKVKTINKLMHSASFRKGLNLFGAIAAASIGLTGALLVLVGTNTSLKLVWLGIGLLFFCFALMFFIHAKGPISTKYHLFISDKKLISVTGKIENEGVKRFNLRKEDRYGASVVIRASDNNDIVRSTEFIVPCVCHASFTSPTFDVGSGMVYFPSQYSEEFL